MSNILNEEIKKNLYGIVQENIDDYEYFHFGEFVEKPNQCGCFERNGNWYTYVTVSYTHLRAHETGRNLVCRLLLEKKKKKTIWIKLNSS